MRLKHVGKPLRAPDFIRLRAGYHHSTQAQSDEGQAGTDQDQVLEWLGVHFESVLAASRAAFHARSRPKYASRFRNDGGTRLT